MEKSVRKYGWLYSLLWLNHHINKFQVGTVNNWEAFECWRIQCLNVLFCQKRKYRLNANNKFYCHNGTLQMNFSDHIFHLLMYGLLIKLLSKWLLLQSRRIREIILSCYFTSQRWTIACIRICSKPHCWFSSPRWSSKNRHTALAYQDDSFGGRVGFSMFAKGKGIETFHGWGFEID